MLSHYLVDLLIRDFSPHLSHSILYVFLSDLIVAVDIELSEDGLEFLVSEELLHTDRRCEELRVVNERVTVIVELLNDFLKLLCPYLMMVIH